MIIQDNRSKAAANPSSDSTSSPRAGLAQVEDSVPSGRVLPSYITEQKGAEEQGRLQHTLALALAAASDLKQGLQVCLETALLSSSLDAGGFYLVEETSGALDFLVPQGLTADFVQSVSRFESDSDHARLIMAGLPAYLEFEDLGLSLSEAERREGLRFIAVIPLHHEGKVIGCMNVASHAVDDLPPANRRVLEAIAAMATQAITRLRAEERLRAREALLNETQRLSKVGGWEWDLIRQTMIWTEEMYRLHDLSAQDLAPGSEEHIRRSAACYGPEHQAAVLAAFHRCVERGEDYDLEVPFTSVQGRPMWVRTTAQAVWEENRIVKVVGNLMDITERKQAEETARLAQDFSETIIDSIPGTFYMLDERGGYVRCNAYQRDEIIGRPETEAVGFSAIDTIHPDDREMIGTRIANVLKNGICETVEGRVLLRGGPAFRWFLLTGRRMVVDGKAFLVGIGIDIDERKQVVESLKASEMRFKELLRNVPSVAVQGSDILTSIGKSAGHRENQ